MAAPTLSEFCLMLRNANPEVWDGFVRAFTSYTHEAMEGLAAAPADKLLLMQGRVQQCQGLLRTFNECALPNRKPAP